jgi:hypothetical protein
VANLPIRRTPLTPSTPAQLGRRAAPGARLHPERRRGHEWDPSWVVDHEFDQPPEIELAGLDALDRRPVLGGLINKYERAA